MILKADIIKKNIRFMLVCAACIFLLASCGEKAPSNSQGSGGIVSTRTGTAVKEALIGPSATPIVVDEAAQQENIYIIKNIDDKSEIITCYALSLGQDIRFAYGVSTKFLDRYGNNTSMSNFGSGSVVVVGQAMESGAVSYVRVADDVWRYEGVTKFTVDEGRQILSIGVTNYKLSPNTLVYSGSNQLKISDISDTDVLSIVGVNRDVISITVTSGHGYLHITDPSGIFKDSLIFIGKNIVKKVTHNMTIEVPEGSYEITVANDGWGGSATYAVARYDTTEVNLDDMKGEGPSICVITFDVATSGAFIFIDGHQVNYLEPVEVRYGAHKLRVVADGYEDWEKTLVVNSATAHISLALDAQEASPSPAPSQTPTPTPSPIVYPSYWPIASPSPENNSNYTDLDILQNMSELITNLLN